MNILKFTAAVLALSGAALSVFAANSDQNLKAPFKAKTVTAALNTVKPTVKGNTISYGERKVVLNENASITCTQPDGPVFDLTHYYVELKDKKVVGSFSPEAKRNKRIIMGPITFADNVFTQQGKYSWEGRTGEFLQTVRILPDGRLEVTNQLTLPAELRERVVEDGFFFNFPSADTYGKDILMLGPKKGEKRVLTVSYKENHTELGNWHEIPSQLIFGKGTAKEVTFVTNASNGSWSIRNYVKRTAFRAQAVTRNNPSRRSSIIIDLTKVPNWKKDTRPDFVKLENIRTYDDELTRNLMPDPSFEQGPGGHARIVFAGFNFSKKKWDGKIFSVDPKVGYDGTSSLRINTFCDSRRGDWRGIWEAGDVTLLPVIVSPGDYVFSCYVKGNRKGQEISIWPGRTSLPIEKDLPPKLRGDRWMSIARKAVPVTSQWTRIEIPIKVKIDQPMCVSFNGISPTKDGSIWIDCIQLERGTKATRWVGRPVESILRSEKEDNFLEYGKKHNISLTVTSEVTGKAETKVVDFYDNVVWSRKYDLKQGKQTIKLNFNPDRGVFVVKTDYTLANGKKTWDAHRFSVMDFLKNTHKHKNLYGLDYGLPFQRANVRDLLSRAQKVGFGSKPWIHCYTQDAYDLLKQYNMEFSHAPLTARAGQYGYTYHVIYAKSPYNGRSDSSLVPICKDFRDEVGVNGDVTEDYLKRFKAAIKVRLKNYPWIRRWSYHGEDDAADPTFSGLMAPEKNFRNYVKLQLAALEAVKEFDPSLEMIGGQIPCNTHPTGVPALIRFIKTAHEINPKLKFDSFAIHTYRHRPEDPDLDLDIAHLRAAMKKYGYGENVPLYFPEGGQYNLYYIPAWRLEISMWNAIHSWLYGAASYEMGWTEKIVSGLYARHYLTILKYPNSSFANIAALSGMIYEMDLATTPFATQKVINTMGHLLGDADFVKDIRFAPFVRCYVFEDGQKRPVAAVWTHEPEIEKGAMDAMVAAVPFGKEKIEVFDLMEAQRKPVYTKDGKLRIGVSAQPMFLRGQKGRTAEFVKALSGARIIEGGNILPVDLNLQITQNAGKLHVKNPADTPFTGSIVYNGKPMPVNVAGGKTAVLNLPYAKPLTDNSLTKQKMELALGKFELDRTFEGVVCHKVGANPDWDKLPAIQFTRKKGAKDANDFSGSWQIAWNDQFFFLRVMIQDDKFVHEEYSIPTKRWDNDSLQIYFDTFCNARSKTQTTYDLDDYEYAVYPNKEGTRARLWRVYQPDIQLTLGTKTPPSYTFADDVKTTFTNVPGGYVYEVAFPVKYLLPIQLKEGCFFGFGLFANDRDNGAHSKGYLTNDMFGKGCYNRPKAWPVILLTK